MINIDSYYVIGPLNTESIESLDEEVDVSSLREKCRDFYIEAILEIKQRFVFDDAFFYVVQMVKPKNARMPNPPTFRDLFRRFPDLRATCDQEKAETEWRAQSVLPCEELGGQHMTEDAIRLMDAECYWNLVLNLTVVGGNSARRFPNLAKVISYLFIIPCSNAIAERLFSTLKLNKTVFRNALSNQVLSGLVRMKTLMKNRDADAATVLFDEALVHRVTKVRANKTLPELVN